jgi:hypothetical protein
MNIVRIPDMVASGPHNRPPQLVVDLEGLAPELTKEQAATLTAVSTGVRGLRGQDSSSWFKPLLVVGALAYIAYAFYGIRKERASSSSSETYRRRRPRRRYASVPG